MLAPESERTQALLPAILVAVGLAWSLWGLSPWVSLFLPAAAAVAIFFALSAMASAWG
jgi:hypothetical protein